MENNDFDIAIIGGGITGAGLFRELSTTGLKICLIEKNDFASGTSSKSSKLVHGGLRYLKEGNLMLTLESVHHRERLLKEAPYLVRPIEFVMPLYNKQSPGKLTMGAGLTIYDIMALKKRHKFITKKTLIKRFKHLKTKNLIGAYSFTDARTDDAMLVIRLIHEGLENKNAKAWNYCEVKKISSSGKTKRILIKTENGDDEIRTKIIINASGVWADSFAPLPDKRLHVRPLKGSHLVIKKDKLNINSAISFLHPKDKRPVFFIPWEGAVLLGTTDIDAKSKKDLKISKKEIDYLLNAAKFIFPDISIEKQDIISTFSGIRPVISSGSKAPSEESREHIVWEKNGIISVTGGKLTTFRKLAWDTLEYASKHFKNINLLDKKAPVFKFVHNSGDKTKMRLHGRYGENINFNYLKKNDLMKKIPGTKTFLAEIYIASKDKTIKHLDDLLMRRLRIGLLLENGALGIIDQIKDLTSENLGWDEQKWKVEIERYKKVYNDFFSPKIQ